MQLFDLLHDYQHLRAKESLVPLEPAEAARLEGLERLLCGECEEDERRVAPRFGFPRPLPVQIAPRGSQGFLAARLREIGAQGAALEVAMPLPEGRLILYFDDVPRRLRYEMPAVLVWQAGGHAGIRFEGMPARRSGNEGNQAA